MKIAIIKIVLLVIETITEAENTIEFAPSKDARKFWYLNRLLIVRRVHNVYICIP
jgi:hypothetical protein